MTSTMYSNSPEPWVGARPAARSAIVVVMGVSGAGKSTVGRLMASRMKVPYLDADDLHPPANLAKMRAGQPLDDEDRRPWLAAVAAWMQAIVSWNGGAVVACSALKRRYRDILRQSGAPLVFVHLVVDRELAGARVAGREKHFMPVSLVVSQYADLEPLESDEPGFEVNASADADDIAERASCLVEGSG